MRPLTLCRSRAWQTSEVIRLIPSRIVIFGSSSVQGRGDPEGGGFVGRLRRWHEGLAEENVTFNLGLSGDTTSRMLVRFEPEVSIRRPGLIVLYPGLNDCRRTAITASPALPAQEFHDNISALVARSVSIAPTLFVSAFPVDESRTRPWRSSGLYYLASDATLYSKIGREVCTAAGVIYLPIFEEWSTRADASTLSLDGLHGTPSAHALLASELRDLICAKFAREQTARPQNGATSLKGS